VTARAIQSAETLARGRPQAGAWAVFAVSFALLLSDYMSRQALAAVFPLLKADWSLTDAALGALGGAVALVVGLLTVPLSLVADRIGRTRAVVIMAATWSVATLACGLCASYGQLMAARLALGAGEAAYGSVGLAVVFSYFPASRHATLTGAFMAGGVLGSFIGMALGGAVAGHFGWRAPFYGLALVGFALSAAYVLATRSPPAVSDADAAEAGEVTKIPLTLLVRPKILITCLASGLQLLVVGAYAAWIPSFLNRSYGVPVSAAGALGGALLLFAGLGMVVCGAFSDRISVGRPASRPLIASAFALTAFAFLEIALALPAGLPQIVCAALGLFCAAGSAGPAGAIVAGEAPASLHGAALAVLTLFNNLAGLAPGPVITGVLADRLELPAALRIVAVAALAAAVGFQLAARIQSTSVKPASAV
jgi:MFS family permease